MTDSVDKPIWALRNELDMLRMDAERVGQRQKELDALMKILHVVEIVQGQNFDRRDLIITVKFSDMVRCSSVDDALLEAEIRR
ncbi:MAG: hypothetical protein WC428_08060 [Candidatus Paceibacterota bacterium]